MEYNIIIADDHKMLSDGLETIIHESGLGVVMAKVNNGKDLLRKLNSTQVALVILDVNMPVMDGLEAAEFIKLRYPQVKILVVSQHESIAVIEKFRSLNVEGYLPKSMERADLVNAIEKIKNNEKVFFTPEDVSDKKGKQLLFLNNDKYNLSEREYEIVLMIVKGMTTRQIAQKLYLSEYTVETHRKNIGRKTGAHNPAAIVKFAMENKIIS